MCRTHALLRNCRDNAKLACHCTARSIIEWIYIRTKVSGPDSLEVALEMRKKEKLTNGLFFEHLVLICTTVLMNDLGLVRCTICWSF